VVPDESRPRSVTVAFWCQIALGALLFAVTVGNGVGGYLFVESFGDAATGGLGSTSGLLVVSAVLTVTAFGLRRGSRVAYRLSLAGLILPMLGLVAASVLDAGTTRVTSGGWSSDVAAVDRWATWMMLSHAVNDVVYIAGPGLATAAVCALATAEARRFFFVDSRSL
jgi:hypothetical protein